MSRSIQQQAEYLAGTKTEGDPTTIRANAAILEQLAIDLSNDAERMGKTHLNFEGPVIRRANARAADRKRELLDRATEVTDLALRMKQIASDVEKGLADWNVRYERELARLGGTRA